MTTYTLYRTIDYDNKIIARGLSAVDAMYFIIEHDPTRYFQLFVENFETFRRFDFALFRDDHPEGEILLHATVPCTNDSKVDKGAALEVIAAQFLRIAHDYWDGRCDTDESFDDGLKYAAEREDASRMEREIAVKFVDALALDGYTSARDIACNDFPLASRAEREDFLKFVFDALIGEVTVYRPGAAHRFEFNLGGDGWDIIRSTSGRLEVLIETVIEPYRSIGHAAKSRGAITLDLKRQGGASDAVDHS
jgi:hypothetical protein